MAHARHPCPPGDRHFVFPSVNTFKLPLFQPVLPGVEFESDLTRFIHDQRCPSGQYHSQTISSYHGFDPDPMTPSHGPYHDFIQAEGHPTHNLGVKAEPHTTHFLLPAVTPTPHLLCKPRIVKSAAVNTRPPEEFPKKEEDSVDFQPRPTTIFGIPPLPMKTPNFGILPLPAISRKDVKRENVRKRPRPEEMKSGTSSEEEQGSAPPPKRKKRVIWLGAAMDILEALKRAPNQTATCKALAKMCNKSYQKVRGNVRHLRGQGRVVRVGKVRDKEPGAARACVLYLYKYVGHEKVAEAVKKESEVKADPT